MLRMVLSMIFWNEWLEWGTTDSRFELLWVTLPLQHFALTFLKTKHDNKVFITWVTWSVSCPPCNVVIFDFDRQIMTQQNLLIDLQKPLELFMQFLRFQDLLKWFPTFQQFHCAPYMPTPCIQITHNKIIISSFVCVTLPLLTSVLIFFRCSILGCLFCDCFEGLGTLFIAQCLEIRIYFHPSLLLVFPICF